MTALRFFKLLIFLGLLSLGVVSQAGDVERRLVRLYGSGALISLNDEGTPYRLGLGVGCPVWDERVWLISDLVYSRYDVNAVADEHPSDDVEGGSSSSLGVDLSLRCELFRGKHVTGFVCGGGGFQNMLESPPFPADGSERNFTLFCGPGLLIPVGERSRFALSLRYFHISNAWLFDKNSGYDGVLLVVGSEWDWE